MLILVIMTNATGIFDDDQMVVTDIRKCESVEDGVVQTAEYFRQFVGPHYQGLDDDAFQEELTKHEMTVWTTDDVEQSYVERVNLIHTNDFCVGLIKEFV